MSAEITLQASCTLPTLSGVADLHIFGKGSDGPEEVAAIVHRVESAKTGPPLVRLHSACFTGDVLGSMRCDCGPQLQGAIDLLFEADHGILLYLLRHEGRGIGLANKIRAYALQDKGLDTVEANIQLDLPVDSRNYTPAVAALRWLGIDRVRLITNNPAKMAALVDGGIGVERLPHSGFVNPHNFFYLRTKDQLLGHLNSLGPSNEEKVSS
ncbi:GTP cyclohydrolase II [Streptosporangium sp. NPDC000396]|uniref:GTP cyclohydrolase II n=1 Tax=Streptosporangium sp. NPDC000396 TaxID=3366185 RepID=UPI00367D53EF